MDGSDPRPPDGIPPATPPSRAEASSSSGAPARRTSRGRGRVRRSAPDEPSGAASASSAAEDAPSIAVFDPSQVEVPADLLALVPERVARAERILPIRLEGELLWIACASAPSPETLDRLRFLVNRPVSVVVCEIAGLLAAIDRCYGAGEGGQPAGAETKIDFVEIQPPTTGGTWATAMPEPDSPQVDSLLQRLIAEAFQYGASRLLVLPVRDRLKIAYRIGDAVYTRDDPAPEMLYPLLARLMTMTNFDGGIKVFLGKQQRRLHARFKPTRYGLSAMIEVDQTHAAAESCRHRAAKLGYPYVALEEMAIPTEVLAEMPHRVAREYRVLPVAIDGRSLVVATSDPERQDLLDQIRFVLNRPIRPVMAPEGMILASIERYYGPPDAEAADLILWEFAHAEDAATAAGEAEAAAAPPQALQLAQAIRAHLATLYRPGMFELFEDLHNRAQLCERDPATGNLEVVFPQSHLVRLLPAGARRYLEDQIWLLREAILARLENYLERHSTVRGVATTYAQYLAARQWAAGRPAPIDPARARDAWVNFAYALAIRFFPHLESNGTLLSFLTDQIAELTRRVDALLEDASLVVQPGRARSWLARQLDQTSIDEGLDSHSDCVARLIELLLSEAARVGASALLILPWPRHVEVAYRVHDKVYTREDLPLRLLSPVVDRLAQLSGLGGEFTQTLGGAARRLRVAFSASAHGLSAVVSLLPDAAAAERCRVQAAALGYPVRHLDQVQAPPALLHLLPKAIAWRKLVLPIAAQGGTLTVALADPPSPRRINELRLILNSPITVALAAEDDLRAAIYRHYNPEPSPAPSPTAVAMLLRPRAQAET